MARGLSGQQPGRGFLSVFHEPSLPFRGGEGAQTVRDSKAGQIGGRQCQRTAESGHVVERGRQAAFESAESLRVEVGGTRECVEGQVAVAAEGGHSRGKGRRHDRSPFVRGVATARLNGCAEAAPESGQPEWLRQ